MKKLSTAIMALVLASAGPAAAQSAVIEKALKDPARKSKEARADMKMADSVKQEVVSPAPPVAPRKKAPVATRKKKRKCAGALRNKKSS